MFPSMRSQWIVCVLYCIIPCSLAAQNDYIFTRYTQEDGLTTASVMQVVKEKHGFLWMTSEYGVIRFDGYDFKLFKNKEIDSVNIPFSNFYELRTDVSGIYYRNRNTICKYFQETGSFKKVMYIPDSLLFNDWANGPASVFWATSTNYLLRINTRDSSVLKFPYPANYNRMDMRIPLSTMDAVWIANLDHELLRFNPATGKFIQVKVKDPGEVLHKGGQPIPKSYFSIQDGTVRLLARNALYFYDERSHVFVKDSLFSPGLDKDEQFQGEACVMNGMLFIGTNRGNLFCLNLRDASSKKVHLFNTAATEGSPEFVFRSIYAANDSSIWISTSNAGVFHYFIGTGACEQFVHDPANQNSLLSNSTDFICANEENLVWINCPGRGLIKAELTKPVLPSYIPQLSKSKVLGTLTENVRSIHALDSANLLIGTLGGFMQFNEVNHTFQELVLPGGEKPILPEAAISSIVQDKKGNIWISEWSTGAIYFLNYPNSVFEKIVPDKTLEHYPTIRTLLCDSHGYLWAGSDRSTIYRADISSVDYRDPQSIRFTRFSGKDPNSGMKGMKQCYIISEDKNGWILFGTADGLYAFDHSTGKFSHFVNHPGDTTSLSSDDIRSICVDHKGRIWLGTTDGGLNLFDKSAQKFHAYTTTNGLPNNTIYSILEDDQGFLWLGTNKGLCRFNPVNSNCRNFTQLDGIQNYEYNTSAGFKTKSGELVIGGRSGFNYFHPDSIETSSEAPEVMITQFRIFGNEQPLTGGNIRLSHRENSISFTFAALSFIRNKENEYAYKLEGLDKDWIYCGDRRFTNYSNLAPGTYTFRVKASNCFGLWNETGTALTLVVATPWWATLYFRLSVFFYVAILLYAFFMYRLRQRLKLQSVRNRIARDLHDEIGSNLSSISLFNEVAIGNAGTTSQVAPLLRKIGEYTQLSQEAMNDIVWMINARNDKFENIIIHMRTLAAEIFEAKIITLHMNIDDRLNMLKMEMDMRKNFFLVYKESVNNIIKYAECKNVWIDLVLDRSTVILRIRDDGKGFDLEHEVYGNGLINMQKRAEAMKGNLDIQSEPGKGTKVELSFRRKS